MPNYFHYCPDWDFMEIDADSPEYEACTCEIDSDGRGPEYHKGDRVYVHPIRMQATVIRQVLQHDYPESFWGNLELRYDDDIIGTSHCWQCERIENGIRK